MKLSEKLAALEEQERLGGSRSSRDAAGVGRSARPQRPRAAGPTCDTRPKRSSSTLGRRQAPGPRAGPRRGRPEDGRPVRRGPGQRGQGRPRQHPPARGRPGLPPRAPQVRAGDDLRHPRLRPARPAAARRRPSPKSCATPTTRSGSSGEAGSQHDRPLVHRRHPVPPGHREDRLRRRPPHRRGLTHGRRPPARRLPRQRHHPARWPSTGRSSPSGSSPPTPTRSRT